MIKIFTLNGRIHPFKEWFDKLTYLGFTRLILNLIITTATSHSLSGQVGTLSIGGLCQGDYKVGYKVDYKYDNTRSFSRKRDFYGRYDSLNNRLIQCHLWYPALIEEDDQPMSYSEYIIAAYPLFAKNGVGGSVEAAAIQDYKANMLERGASESLADSILLCFTNAYRDVPGIDKKFPLIIYAPSINSDPYENSIMIEYLVSNGYIVISSPSRGDHSPDVSRDHRGAEAQLGDLEFLLSEAWGLQNADTKKIGTIGFSWGGMTNVLLAMSNYNIDAVVSLDGAIGMSEYLNVASGFHCYGVNNMTAAYLHIIPGKEERDISFYNMLKYSDALLVRIENTLHGDFASDFLLKHYHFFNDKRGGDTEYLGKFYSSMCHAIKDFIDISLNNNNSNPEIGLDTEMVFSKIEGKYTIDKKNSLRVPPTEQEFLNTFFTRGSAEAERIFDMIREKDSTAIFFREEAITGLFYQLGPEQADDLIRLLKLNIRAYPKSAISFFMLGQAYYAVNDIPSAIINIEKSISLDPGNKQATRFLNILRQK